MASQQPNEPCQSGDPNEATSGSDDFNGFSTSTEWAESFTDAQITALMHTPRFLQHAIRFGSVHSPSMTAPVMNDTVRRTRLTPNLYDQPAPEPTPAAGNAFPHINRTDHPNPVRFYLEALWSLSAMDISLDRFAVMVLILGGFDIRRPDLLQFMRQFLEPHEAIIPRSTVQSGDHVLDEQKLSENNSIQESRRQALAAAFAVQSTLPLPLLGNPQQKVSMEVRQPKAPCQRQQNFLQNFPLQKPGQSMLEARPQLRQSLGPLAPSECDILGQAPQPAVIFQGQQNVVQHDSSHQTELPSFETRPVISLVSDSCAQVTRPGATSQQRGNSQIKAKGSTKTRPQDVLTDEEKMEEPLSRVPAFETVPSSSDTDGESKPMAKENLRQQTGFTTQSQDQQSTKRKNPSKQSEQEAVVSFSEIVASTSSPPPGMLQRNIFIQEPKPRLVAERQQSAKQNYEQHASSQTILAVVSRQTTLATCQNISEPIPQAAVQQRTSSELPEQSSLLQRKDSPKELYHGGTNASNQAEIYLPCECVISDTLISKQSSLTQAVPNIDIWISTPNPEQFRDVFENLDHQLILASAKVVKDLLDAIPTDMMDRVFYIETFAKTPMRRDERSELDLARQGRAILASGELLLEIFSDAMTDVQAGHLFAMKLLASEDIVGSMEGEAWDDLRSGNAILSNPLTLCTVLMEMMGELMDIVIDINPLFDFTTKKPKKLSAYAYNCPLTDELRRLLQG